MRTGIWRALSALAVAGAMSLSTGCSSKPCDDVRCNSGETCNPDTGRCEGGDLCADVTCESGESCNPANGQCEAAGPCAEVTCENATDVCVDGVCRDRCELANCNVDESCEATTGVCTKRCETNTKPTGKSQCPTGQVCDPADGTCKSTGPNVDVGAACETAGDCGDSTVAICGTQLGNGAAVPGGYCMSPCGQGNPVCPSGSVCLGNAPNQACYASCAGDKDCRGLPYRCVSETETVNVCWLVGFCDKENPADCGYAGEDCKAAGDCMTGARCIPEIGNGYTGFDGGMCMWEAVANEDCPPNTTRLAQVCWTKCTAGLVDECGYNEFCLEGACIPRADIFIQRDPTKRFPGACVADADCKMAMCTPQETGACGEGQPCVNGFCKTADRCAEGDTPCSTGVCDEDTGDCVDTSDYCDSATGYCIPVGCTQNEQCGVGLVCNQENGRCERPCESDENCGPSARCEVDTCVPRCGRWTESVICGDEQRCNMATGECQAPCTETTGCNFDSQYCEVTTGRCQPICSTDDQCGAGEVCTSMGRCQMPCTVALEISICGNGWSCQTSTGHCLPMCSSDPSVCGEEACNVREAPQRSRCGQTCNVDGDCSVDPNGFDLVCRRPTPSDARRCTFRTCTDETVAADCGENQICSDGRCKVVTID